MVGDTVEEQGNVRLLLEEGNLSHGDWMKASILIIDDGWGIDILQEVTRRKVKTRVIIMTAHPSTETAQDSFRLLAVDYLVTPLRHGGLINSVKKALQQ